jgi:GAF domain-containing protein/signal transduction histidine kinase
MLGATNLEGPDGLYFRTATAAQTVTAAKHGIVVVPSSVGKLRVVGYPGAPKLDEKEFADDRGIISKAFREKGFVLVNNVKDKEWEKDYYSFDPLVKSELAVPIFDRSHTYVEAIINVEDEEVGHFSEDKAWLLYGFGQVMMIKATELLRKEHFKNKYSNERRRLETENERVKGILDIIPDEVMIVDKNFRPVYANLEKQRNHPTLKNYLRNSGDWIESLFESKIDSLGGKKNCCYFIIEGKDKHCKKCVCKRAMDSRENFQGVIYKPEILDDIVELSAAPLFSNGDIIGCIETARYITKRQRVLDGVPNLLENAYKEKPLLEAIVKLLKIDLKYERIRIYSIDVAQMTMAGIVYEGEHPGLTEETFSKRKVIPEVLRKGFLWTNTTGRLVVGDVDEKIDEAHSYWEMKLSHNTMKDVMNKIYHGGIVELEGIPELAVVPLTARDERLIMIVEPEGESRGFTCDDLQALTIFAHLVSTALAVVKVNQLRFKLAVVGETAFGLEHIFARFFEKPKTYTRKVFEPFGRLLGIGIEYLKTSSTKENNDALCKFLLMMKRVVEREIDIPNKGDVMEWAEELKEELNERQLSLPDGDILDEIVRVRPSGKKEMEVWKSSLLNALDNTVLLQLFASTVQIIVSLKNQGRIPWEISLFAEAFRSIAYTESQGAEIQVKHNIIRILRFVVGMMNRINTGTKVTIIEEYSDETRFAKINAGVYFLAFQALLQNAIEAASVVGEEGRVIVKAGEFFDEEKQQDMVKISISNNGDRIREQDWDKIFIEPIRNKTKPNSHGLGLLFIHDWVMSVEGSNIVADYEKYRGMTIFSIEVPLIV